MFSKEKFTHKKLHVSEETKWKKKKQIFGIVFYCRKREEREKRVFLGKRDRNPMLILFVSNSLIICRNEWNSTINATSSTNAYLYVFKKEMLAHNVQK